MLMSAKVAHDVTLLLPVVVHIRECVSTPYIGMTRVANWNTVDLRSVWTPVPCFRCAVIHSKIPLEVEEAQCSIVIWKYILHWDHTCTYTHKEVPPNHKTPMSILRTESYARRGSRNTEKVFKRNVNQQ